MATRKKNYKNFKYVPRLYLSKLREAKGLSQIRFASKIQMDRPTYNQIENGKQGFLMNARRLMKIAEVLGVPVEMVCREEIAYLDEVDKVNGIVREV